MLSIINKKNYCPQIIAKILSNDPNILLIDLGTQNTFNKILLESNNIR